MKYLTIKNVQVLFLKMVDKMVIVAVYAHPDDGEFLAGGSLAKWVEEGHQVHVICATNGNLGTRNLSMTKEKLAEIRKEELREAMKIIGGNPPIFLGQIFIRQNPG